MLLSLRSPGFQLCLLVFGLLSALTWYRGYVRETTRRWYDLANSKFNLTSNHLSVINVNSQIAGAGLTHADHKVLPNGLLETNLKAKHPLWNLLHDAEVQWDKLNAKQSSTLKEAVAEYERRNGYPPPAGFDMWWDFVRKNKVKLVDEFDQINYDITPYLAMSPAQFRKRLKEIGKPDVGHHVNITNGELGYFGPQALRGNQRQLRSVMMGFSRALPDLVMHGHSELRSDFWIGKDLREAAKAKARAGEYFTDAELNHFESLGRNDHKDRKYICLPDDPVFNNIPSPNGPTFISSHLTYMSPCANHIMHRAPPILFSPEAMAPRLKPYFVFSKHRPDSGLLLPSNFWEFYEPLLEEAHDWKERHGGEREKLFWRGKPTGWNWNNDMRPNEPVITWRDGARPKFALMFGASTTQSEAVDVLMESVSGHGLEMRTFKRTLLNEKWMDVGLTGTPIQCNAGHGTCEEMRLAPIWKQEEDARKKPGKKFVADLDSNEWSNEFQRKLSWGNVVLKATTYPEWNTDWLIPYYHYIPIQSDYSDVYNILAFFLGDPETGVGAHQEIAAIISQRASSFVREYWRREDMQAYLYRLMLEYARLGNDDRVAGSFRL